MQYKVRVPVCGAVILNETCDKVLLVRGFKASAAWMFPRGKINKDEKRTDCAVRECIEEIGFDISPYVKEKDVVQRTIREQQISLFIVKGIPEETEFQTQTRKEIGDIASLHVNFRNGSRLTNCLGGETMLLARTSFTWWFLLFRK